MSAFSSSSSELFQKFSDSLETILTNLPKEWQGTTFKNSNLLGRELFSSRLCNLVETNGPTNITTDDLINLGNAEDYLRVSSNISCLLETFLALKYNYNISQIFTFASRNLSIIAVLLTASPGTPVHLFLGSSPSPFRDEHLEMLKLLSTNLLVHHTAPTAQGEDDIILALINDENGNGEQQGGGEGEVSRSLFQHPHVHGLISQEGILFIKDLQKIAPSQILIIRKRLSTPMTTPLAENMLRQFCRLPLHNFDYNSEEEKQFQTHLQRLSGTVENLECPPISYTAGLPAVCSLWMTLVARGGADVVMASTAYGGSSELTDIIATKASNFKKHKFDITGRNEIIPAVQGALQRLQSLPSDELQARTVLFLEIPTNPDMKVPSILELATLLVDHQRVTGKQVLLLVDTTFAPNSQILSKIETIFPELTCVVFISMSKSISRGITTAGALVAGSSFDSCELLNEVKIATEMFDTSAKADQVRRLIDNHVGVEERCVRAYENASYLGNRLRELVSTYCHGYEMPLAFVTPEQAAQGFTSSTFSFNLPPISTHHVLSNPIREQEINAHLAQHFVDLLCNQHPEEFKPCVSFGQDNGLVYATVPATSTQGAIHPDDKAKQAIGGVQLTRLSFPPTCDLKKLEDAFKKCILECYEVSME